MCAQTCLWACARGRCGSPCAVELVASKYLRKQASRERDPPSLLRSPVEGVARSLSCHTRARDGSGDKRHARARVWWYRVRPRKWDSTPYPSNRPHGSVCAPQRARLAAPPHVPRARAHPQTGSRRCPGGAPTQGRHTRWNQDGWGDAQGGADRAVTACETHFFCTSLLLVHNPPSSCVRE